jgi:L-arabinose isomerase
MLEHRKLVKGKIGYFGIGLARYWEQFEGLKERLEGYIEIVRQKLVGFGSEVISCNLVDSEYKASEAALKYKQNDVDLIVCYITTYAVSSTVIPIAQNNKGVPVLVLNLQPTTNVDYESAVTGEWLANGQACCVPEISCAFARCGIKFNVVSGGLDDEIKTWKEIGEWIIAANVARTLKINRCGYLGHYYPGMLDMYSDFTMLHGQLGTHVEILEMEDLKKRVDTVDAGRVSAIEYQAREMFELDENARGENFLWACSVAAGLEKMMEDFQLNSLAYYYRGLDGNEFEILQAGMILGCSLLTAKGIPCSGEADIKNAMAMMIMDSLGAGGSFTEFYAMDFKDNFVLMGHDGPGHVAISDKKPVLRGLGVYHGKRGSGVSVEFNVKLGPITILGLTQTVNGKFKMVAAHGESISGPILKVGNTNSRIDFGIDPGDFVTAWAEQGPTHHCALGIGHRISTLKKVARIMDIELVSIIE